MKPDSLPPEAVVRPILDARDDAGSLSMWTPVPGVVVSQSVGHLSQALARRWIDATNLLWKQGLVWEFFNDWELLDSYDSGARRDLTDHVLRNKATIGTSSFLTKSKLVAMGVAAAGAATALVGITMRATTDRADWARHLRARLALGRSDHL